ncbi:nicotinate-nucleotide--dimethylbenzimidazole phosphoribosyltransferase [Mariprofundus erugo]|uniref:Nicotinate-nucleotide--dimethylbenzimidazole phosphoribosyltransferase n=1 Tax=Mariprofundus erugo TaxID=2528639 RepID=A0A5R9GPR9_9PROT|nr:nicotinate-nucleotide--dimethylbenzimidazole phosphoribosyltransferase [Mariprofundus erugo]TLS67055.1 nicotinate-nucleotide--dimethylbenzimidazole phosphoribosyltransferase [Mariprofundus erugo]
MDIPSIHPEQGRHNPLFRSGRCIERLDEIAAWFSARQNRPVPEQLKVEVVLFAADHGVAESMDSNAKTIDQLQMHAAVDSPIRQLCQLADAQLHMVDLGVAGNLIDADIDHAKVRSNGSADITSAPAMDQMDYWECVGIGEEMANRAIANGANLLIAGSIACGDHVAVAAIIAELTGLSADEALYSTAAPETYTRELIAVEQAIARAQGTPSHDLLREIGGLEIAAMAGFYRAAASKGVPVLLDGRASAAAALAAIAWDVRIAGWMLASHLSDEAGHREALESLGLEPLVELRTGADHGHAAIMLLPLLKAAIAFRQATAIATNQG